MELRRSSRRLNINSWVGGGSAYPTLVIVYFAPVWGSCQGDAKPEDDAQRLVVGLGLPDRSTAGGSKQHLISALDSQAWSRNSRVLQLDE